MNKKLTLTINHSVIKKAKRYARGKGQSLSDMVENYLKVVTSEQQPSDDQLTPIVKSLKGSFKDPQHLDYKKEPRAALAKKYQGYRKV